jgi:SAM-dependent methyltransferase
MASPEAGPPESLGSEHLVRASEVARIIRAGPLPREEWLASGLFLVELLCQTVNRNDLSEVDLLDVGCGTLLVKTLMDNSLPIGHYTGIDAGAEVIEWLRTNVSDPRLEFHHLDAHNAMYNPAGKPLASFQLLPFGERRFDLICLFSVFTHLAPDDYVAMLRLLRRHVKQDGRLLFSLFLDDPEHPSPFAEALREQLQSGDPQIRDEGMAKSEMGKKARRLSVAAGHDPRFLDEIPEEPLKRARYTRDYAVELVEGTGWEIGAIQPPHPRGYIQHYMVCNPI